MTGAINRYERVVRMLARIERTAERSLEDYECEFKIQLGDGTELNDFNVARTVVTRWRELPAKYGALP